MNFFQTNEVTKIFDEITQSFNCKPVEGMLSHQLSQNRIDGEKTIIQNPTDKQRYEINSTMCKTN